jgi:phosphatidylglycerophosphate synthase
MAAGGGGPGESAMSDLTTSHVRVNHGVLAAVEQRALVWVANRLPRRIHSDHLTALSVAGTLLAGVSFAVARLLPVALVGVALGLAINWFGDSLDGTLARVRREERPRYGYYVDHVLDVVGAALLVGGIALSGYMTPLLALGVLVAYLLVSAEVFLATAVGGAFRLSFVRIGPTELRVLLAVGALALLRWPEVMPFGYGPIRLFDVGGAIAIGGLVAALGVSATCTGRHLYRAEPRPSSGRVQGSV